jgi:hypothetical protein
MLFEPKTGALTNKGTAVFMEEKAVDPQAFVKLYFEGFQQAAGLSKTAMRVFRVVFEQLQDKKNHDRVLLAQSATDLPPHVFTRGLRELLDAGFLYRSPYPSLFWVNVGYVFNGDRIEFVKSYRRVAAKRPDATQGDMFGAAAPAPAPEAP